MLISRRGDLRMGFRHDGALRGRRKTLAVFCAATAAALAIVVCSGSSAIAGVSAPAVAAQSPVCTENHLVITFSATSSATGHEGDVVRFINLGPDCTLRGYPGVDGLSAHGQVLVHARRMPRGFLGGLLRGPLGGDGQPGNRRYRLGPPGGTGRRLYIRPVPPLPLCPSDNPSGSHDLDRLHGSISRL